MPPLPRLQVFLGLFVVLLLADEPLSAETTLSPETVFQAPETLVEPRNVVPPQDGTPSFNRAVKRSLFASVSLRAAASAGPEGITYEGELTVSSISADCDGEPVSFSSSKVVRGIPSIGQEPSVAIILHRYCVQVSADNPPLELIGRSWPIRDVQLAEFLNGEEYSSPDPADLQAAGASLYLPGERGEGRQIGVFVVAGLLELPDGTEQTFNALAAVAVMRTDAAFEDQRLFVTLISPAGTPVNLMARALAVRYRE